MLGKIKYKILIFKNIVKNVIGCVRFKSYVVRVFFKLYMFIIICKIGFEKVEKIKIKVSKNRMISLVFIFIK